MKVVNAFGKRGFNMKFAENLALNYSVELLFNTNPFYENAHLLEELNKSFKKVELLFSTENLSSFVFYDYVSKTGEIDIPVQILIMKEKSLLNIKKIKNSILQTLDWQDAEEIVDSCKFSLVVSDFMATSLLYNERVYLFNKFLKTLLSILPCKAIHWSYSQKIVEPIEYQNALKNENFNSIYAIVNVRYFKQDTSLIMDTIGLSALGLPDLQCKSHNIEPGIIATILYEYAGKIFENGDYINDNDIISCLNLNFKCYHDFSITNPTRVIINLEII